MRKGIRDLTLLGVFIALSCIGAQLKIQGSIALDALPAFLVAGSVNPLYGAIVGIMGHLISALFSGFPLSLFVHIIVGGLMGVTCYTYGYFKKKHRQILAIVFGFILNAPISLVVTSYIMVKLLMAPSMVDIFGLLIWPLSIGSLISIGLAVMIAPFLDQYLGGRL